MRAADRPCRTASKSVEVDDQAQHKDPQDKGTHIDEREQIERIARQLTVLVRQKISDPDATVGEPAALPGHAGLSYSFELTYRAGATRRTERLVIRLAPEGVPITGPTDVVRQARIMASLAGTAVPVPPIKWYDSDPRWFGRPFFVVGFLKGDKLALGDRIYTAAETRAMVTQAVEALATLHAVPWEPRRDAWGEALSLADEMKRLDNLLDRPTLDPKVVGRGPLLRERLRHSLPAPERVHVGCVHGDFQWSNCLFEAGRLNAVIDWELSQIGATLIDLGWLSLFSDRESWEIQNLVPLHVLHPDEIAELYASKAISGIDLGQVRWFRAFAGYRFGVITAFNLMLHRRGKRPDPTWEDIALSGPRLFERGLELLG
jgi:aminoglycoside phosphotransferase (APT) family kinase protein